jgi:hypothetical protein
MNEDQDFNLGGEKNGYNAGELNWSRPPTQCEKAERGADALQGIGQQWPSDRGNDVRWRLGGFGVRGLGFGVRGLGFGVRGSGFGVLSSVFCLLSSEFCILYSVFLRFAPS